MKHKKNLLKRNLFRLFRLRKVAVFLWTIAVLLVIQIGLLFFLKPGGADAAWFQDDWAYRKAVTITNNTSTEQNVYIQFGGVAETFGQTGNNASTSPSSADSNLVNKAADAESTPANNGRLESVTARLWVDSGTTVARGVVYDASGNLLATGDEVTISNTTEQALTFPFSGAQKILLTAGTKYAYGVHWQDPGAVNINWSRQGTAAASWKNNDTYADGMQDPLGTGTVSGPIDMYVNYTAAGSSALDTSDTTKFQSDCGDLRFTDANGKLLPYYILFGCGTSGTVIQVFLSNFPSGQQTIYFYYGNPSANNGYSASSFATVATNYTIGSVGSEEKGPSPNLYYRFDEGYGTTAQDATANDLDGTISGAIWRSEDLCVVGKCLKFDGSNDVVSRTYSNDTELDPGTSSFSVSAWFRHPVSVSGTDVIISRAAAVDGVGYKVYMKSTGVVCFGIDDDTTTFPEDEACSTASYADSEWHFVEGVKSGTASITVYIDGKQNGQDASLSATGSLSGSSPTFRIGIDSDGTTNPWDGFIDEVKYYDHAHSAEEVKVYFNAKGGNESTSATFGASDAVNTLGNGLAGYWNLDESTANTCIGGTNDSCDSSGNGLDGAWNGSATNIAGKFSNGVDLDGTDDYINILDNNALDISDAVTLAAWIKFDALSGGDAGIVRKDGGYEIRLTNAGRIAGTGFGCTGVSSSMTVTASTWYHVLWTYNESVNKVYINGVLDNSSSESCNIPTSVSDAQIGRDDSYFNGIIDDVRIYNRVLSDIEVSYLANWGPGPVGHWKFEDMTGTNALDTSGSGFTGTLTNGPVWKKGKFGGGVYFDGASGSNGDVIELGDQTALELQTMTISAWVYRQGSCPFSECTIFAKGMSGNVGYGFLLIDSSGYKPRLSIRDGLQAVTGTTTIAVNTWYHVAASFDGTTINLYVNGVLDGTASQTQTPTFGAEQASIGNRNSNRDVTYNGILDNVLVYNYVRTAKQIVSDMNAGHPNVGSPVASAIGHWKFDEGYGTTANNSGSQGSANNGTLAAATAAPAWIQSGKFGKALDFDGTNDTISLGTSAIGSDINGASAVTISAWANIDTLPANVSRERIFTTYIDGGSTGVALDLFDDSGLVEIGARSVSGDSFQTATATLPSTGTWHHLLGVIDYPNDKIYVYVNGVLKTTQSVTFTNTAHTLGTPSSGDRIGSADTSTEFIDGKIDEVKVYNYGLTADEVRVEYNQGKAQTMGSLSVNADGVTASNSAARAYCPPGNSEGNCAAGSNPAPVGEWLLDENTGTAPNDSSGNNFNLSFSGNTSWKSGKIGGGLDFDGTNDYATYADTGTNALDISSSWTVQSWVRLDVVNVDFQTFVIKHSNATTRENYWLGTGATTSQDEVFCEHHNTSGTQNGVTTSGFNLTTNRWYHVACVFNDTADTLTIYIDGVQQAQAASTITTGTGDEDFFIGATSDVNYGDTNGKLDVVRVYNYARTPSQIVWDYNNGGPSGWWKFDECTGTTAYDASGRGNNGTTTAGDASGSNDSVGTCTGSAGEMWADGATGKFNGSLEYDGTNDYTDLGDLSYTESASQLTWSFWVKPNSAGASRCMFCKANSNTNTQMSWAFYTINATNHALQVLVATTTSDTSTFAQTDATVLSNSTWAHVVAVFDGTQSGNSNRLKVYINGKLVPVTYSGTIPASTLATTSNVTTGVSSDAAAGFAFSGQIDDVRIFNYPLSIPQIRDIYNNGAAVRF